MEAVFADIMKVEAYTKNFIAKTQILNQNPLRHKWGAYEINNIF